MSEMGSLLNGVSRRTFMKGVATAGVGAALAAGLAGCSSPKSSEDKGSSSNQSVPNKIDKTIDCDVCVVGAGASGLAAAVQAADLGAQVVCLESQGVTGGNINGVEGCFGIGSSMQKDLGIDIDSGATIRSEIMASQMRASGPGYVDMVHASGANIDWLMDNGVKFGGVDGDKGTLLVFHRFPSGHGKEDYAAPMTDKAKELGVQFEMETAATLLIKNDSGAVRGVYAKGPDGTVQVNAKSVIVATGGFAQNDELMGKLVTNKHLTYGGMDGHDGSGHSMCIDAGARDRIDSAALLIAFDIKGTPGYYDGGLFAFVLGVGAPYAVWVNQDGERYANEDCASENAMMMCMPTLFQEDSLCILDSNMMKAYANGADDEIAKQIEQGKQAGTIYEADSLKELASAAGIPEDAFVATMEEYNGFVDAGSDKNYGKEASSLVKFEKAPFYALRIYGGLNSTIGSVYTDRSFHALDNELKPIDGLYVVGVEGAMLWSNLYTVNVSGGCNANNVNSGRVAAKDAVANL